MAKIFQNSTCKNWRTSPPSKYPPSTSRQSTSRVSRVERISRAKAVLVETGWSRHWNTPQYFDGHPFLTEDAARLLADSGVALVGIDSHNIDDVRDLRRPVHSILLKNEIPIVEHMTNLAALPRTDFRFFAVPVKVKGFGTFPVRAFAIAPEYFANKSLFLNIFSLTL
jgi:kynurenine formamidase